MFKRLRTLREKLYETFMLFMTRHPPKRKIRKREHEPSREMPWYSGDAYPCETCSWVLMRWDENLLGWYCTYCGQHYHPRVAVTEKRAIVIPPTLWQQKQNTPIPYSVALPEQRAVQPPYVRSGMSYQQTQKFEPRKAQVFKKWHTGEIYLDEHGKPRYAKSGLPVHPDQFALLLIPTHKDYRRIS